MNRRDFVRRDGQWGGSPVLSPRDLQRFDDAQASASNGDDGGTANPINPIIIGGQGLALSGSTAHQITGGVKTKRAGRIELGHSDWPQIPSTTRDVRMSLDVPPMPLGQRFDIEASIDPVGTRIAANTGATLQWAIPKRFLHHGATLSSATLTFRVGQQHTAVPSGLPAFILGRMSLGHGTVTAMGTTATFPAPANAAAYYANGSAQSFTFTATTANSIDCGNYTYILEIVDEGGTGALPLNVYTSLLLHYTAITSLQWE